MSVTNDGFVTNYDVSIYWVGRVGMLCKGMEVTEKYYCVIVSLAKLPLNGFCALLLVTNGGYNKMCNTGI